MQYYMRDQLYGTHVESRELTVEVGMADVHVIHAFAREAGHHLLALLLEVEHDRQELFDVARGHVVAVGPLDERLALQVEDRDQAGHGVASERVRE